jgi:hypothetical protein
MRLSTSAKLKVAQEPSPNPQTANRGPKTMGHDNAPWLYSSLLRKLYSSLRLYSSLHRLYPSLPGKLYSSLRLYSSLHRLHSSPHRLHSSILSKLLSSLLHRLQPRLTNRLQPSFLSPILSL